MQKLAHEIYSFDEFRLDLTRGSLFRGTLELKLRPQSFEVLKYLTENHGRLVSKDELIESVWQGMAVTDDSLVQCLKDIRHALGDQAQTIIKTVPRRGYIFDKRVMSVPIAFCQEEATGVHIVIDQFETLGEISADRDLDAVVDLNTVESPKVTRQRVGLVRGFKFVLSGLCVGFVFLILFQALLIFGATFAQYDNNLSGVPASRLPDLIRSLLTTLTLPAVVGWLVGIGLFLFGTARMVYALFERSGSKANPAMVERVIAVLITLVILAIVVPNMIRSFREGRTVPRMEPPQVQQTNK